MLSIARWGPADPESPAPQRRTLLVRTLVVWVWVFACFLTWSLATPFWSSPDAPAHDLMAWHVGHGHLLPDPTEVLNSGVTSNAVTPAPEGLVRSAETVGCYAQERRTAAGCMVSPGDDADLVDFVNPAGRNFPTYYLATGWPSTLFDGVAALYAMRVAAAAIAALFVAWAASAAWTRARPMTALAGVAVALTPMAMYLGGAINPNSLEITAAMALAATSVVFLREPETWLGAVMYRRAMIAAGVMVTIRLLAPVWVLVWVVAFALVADRRAWRKVLTRRGLAWAAVPFLGAVFNVVWTYTAALTDYQDEPKHSLTLAQAFWASKENIDRVGSVSTQVGVFGWLDTVLPGSTYYYYALTVVFLVAVAWVFLPGREALVTAWLLVAAYLVPIVLQAAQWNTNGGVWQGRYTLPLSVMIPIITLVLAADRLQAPRVADLARRFTTVLPLAMVIVAWVHVSALRLQLRRNIEGLDGLAPAEERWSPVVPAEALVLALALLLVVAWLAFGIGCRRERAVTTAGKVPRASRPRADDNRPSQ
ncbi:DUF2142 domain-containing protein [Nocardioides houyundeii]|uniref:DUF2142 domain-containing protein n=1 Tax=Nocardioides houyundeii TaxID=2045452 RepID=UPI000DF479D9|nr:DUF2142 domain-containing protein [Nocardioides houyundeii]